MSKEIFYEDLMENFNKNMREKLIKLVNDNKIIIVKGLNSAQRYEIYRQMYYPLKFEKIITNDNGEKNTDIKIYNYKIKEKECKQNITEKIKEEKTKEQEYILEESEESGESNSDSNSDYTYETKSEYSYFTEDDEQLTRIENIGSQILEKVVNNEKKINRTKSKVNLVILINVIGWFILYTLDPVRLVYIRSTQCEIY